MRGNHHLVFVLVGIIENGAEYLGEPIVLRLPPVDDGSDSLRHFILFGFRPSASVHEAEGLHLLCVEVAPTLVREKHGDQRVFALSEPHEELYTDFFTRT